MRRSRWRRLMLASIAVSLSIAIPPGAQEADEGSPVLVERILGAVITRSASLYPYALAGSTVGRFFTLESEVADLDDDGHLDAVFPAVQFSQDADGTTVGVSSEIIAAYGDGTGAFPRISSVFEGVASLFVRIANMDGDAHPDLLFCEWKADVGGHLEPWAVVLFGDPAGAFTRRVDWRVPESVLSLLAGDTNRDGNTDVVYFYQDTQSELQGIRTWFGDGHGQFTKGPTSLADRGITAVPTCTALDDVNGDGFPDVVAAGNQGLEPTTLLVAYGARGRFEFEWTLCETQRLPMDLEIGDFDGDAEPDIAIAFPWDINTPIESFVEAGEIAGVEESTLVLTLINKGTNTWEQAILDGGVQALSIETGDLDGDGFADVFVHGCRGNIGIALGAALGLPTTASVYSSFSTAPAATGLLGDFNEDAWLDIGTQSTDGALVIREGDGDGGLAPGWFKAPIDSPVPFGTDLVRTAADFDQDGHLDLVYYADFAGVAVAFGDGSGRFEESGMLLDVPDTNISGAAIADFDGDALPDVAIAVRRSGSAGDNSDIWLLLGTGDRAFLASPTPSHSTNDTIREIISLDLNGDQYEDLFLIPVGDNPCVLYGGPSGHFQQGERLAFPSDGPLYVHAPHAADFNGDGRPDLLASARYGIVSEFMVLWLSSLDSEYRAFPFYPPVYIGA